MYVHYTKNFTSGTLRGLSIPITMHFLDDRVGTEVANKYRDSDRVWKDLFTKTEYRITSVRVVSDFVQEMSCRKCRDF